MKILHVIDSLAAGGAEKLLEQSLPRFSNYENVEVHLLLLTDKKNVFSNSLVKQGIKLEVIPLKRPRSPLNVLFLKKYMKQGKYDIVHVHLFPANYWVSIAHKMMKVKPRLLFTEHSTHNKRREKKYYKYIEKFIYSSADKIISISNSTQINLKQWLEVKNNENKYVVIPNGVPINEVKETTAYKKEFLSDKINKKDFLLCMVGSFSLQKDQETVIKAMKNLPANTHLFLIGEGKFKNKNELLVDNLNLTHKVTFLGFRNDVYNIYKTVDAVVVSSNWEGFGLTAVEGMASGKPVIASNVPGLREVVENAGLLFENGDEKHLFEKIEYIFESQVYKEVKQNCLKRAEVYNIDVMVSRYMRIYKNLLKE